MPDDLRIGQPITIYSREFLPVNRDEFTKQWYLEHQGVTQTPMKAKQPPSSLVYHQVPPHNGIGAEADALGSVHSLNPKPPRKDVNKIFKNDMHILRFSCKLVSPEPDDENRDFTISFFCGDDTVLVYEICDKNSGRMGGKFMERAQHKNPATDTPYTEADFAVGKTIYLNGYRF